MTGILQFICALMFTTLWAYWVHRLAHSPRFRKTLWKIHKPHHRINAFERPLTPAWPSFFLWYGGWYKSLDVWLTFFAPAVLAGLVIGGGAWWVLVFHYLYEALLGDGFLDHNPKISNSYLTKFFAIGQYHLLHHKNRSANYGFIVSFWDKLFKTQKQPS